jgi:4a-hydroxytetrahydrobiopterin dehydratase
MAWEERDGCLTQEFVFGDFTEAFAFMTRVAFIAEQHAHHPDWSNTYNRVRISLTTHDAGNVVTDRDRDMAAAIDDVLGR